MIGDYIVVKSITIKRINKRNELYLELELLRSDFDNACILNGAMLNVEAMENVRKNDKNDTAKQPTITTKALKSRQGRRFEDQMNRLHFKAKSSAKQRSTVKQVGYFLAQFAFCNI